MIPLFKVFMSKEAIELASKTLSSGYITIGPRVEEFEKKLVEYIGNKYLLTLNSCTSGIVLALRLLKSCGVNDGDEVLVPSLTNIATINPILENNLNIKWIDVDTNTANVDLEDIKSKLSEKTKVITVVHWGGYPVDLDKLKDIREYCFEKYNFRPYIIEDCAHSFGAEYKGKKLGNHGNICIYSFQAIKTLTTGDGGCIVLPNEELYNRAKLLRWFGIDRSMRNYTSKDMRLENDITEWGYKFNMNDINASLGIENLKYVDKLLYKQRQNVEYYINHIKSSKVRLLERAVDRLPSYWIYTIEVDDRSKFMEHMNGIMVSQVHNRNDKHSCFKKYEIPLKKLDEFKFVCIPCGWWISPEEREHIVGKINSY